MSPRFRWAARLVLALFGLGIGVVSAEFIARRSTGVTGAWLLVNAPNWYDTAIFQPDAELRQVLRPGATGRMRTPEFDTVVRIGAIGTRGEAPGPKAPRALRVLAVGDSFTLGVQVDEADTFCAGLARRLSTRLARPVDVVNAGVDGYGTFEAARQAGRLAPAVGADAILLTFFLGNDLEDNRRFRPGGYPTNVPQLPSLAGPMDRLFAGSALYFHAMAWTKARALAANPDVSGRFRHEALTFTRGTDLRPEAALTRRAFVELDQVAVALGIPVIVALAPPTFVISPERAHATFALFGAPGELDLDAPARVVSGELPPQFLDEDLTPALRAAEPGGRTYFVFDGHWTPRGHDVVAEALTPVLARALDGR